MTCATCHDPAGGAARIGPHLAELKTSLTREQLLDSVLRPSKQIDKAFVQVQVITKNGKPYVGLRVKETKKVIALRNLGKPDTKIAKKDIDEMNELKTSIMPDSLVTLLKDRKEFDDLMKYILETRKR